MVKKSMTKFMSLLLVSVMAVSMVACGKDEGSKANKKNDEKTEISKDGQTKENLYPEFILKETDTQVTYKNSFDEECTVTKKPKKVAVLMNSTLDLWYLAGGTAIARVKGETNVPEAAKDIQDLGSFNKVNIESLLALEPDLIIMASSSSDQAKLVPSLTENKIETAIIDTNTEPYEGFKKNLYLFCKILGTEDKYSGEINNITKRCEAVMDKTKKADKQPNVAIFFTSSKSVQCELPTSLIGDMVQHMGGKNIVDDVNVEGKTKVDFSVEKLIEKDPEYILVTTMGDVDKCKERFNKDVMSNDIWGSLTAVKEGRVYYLPKDLFMYRPNARYGEAFEELGKLIYPEVIK